MKRRMNLETMTDGHLYRAEDMVKVGCGGCKGCSECCSDQAVMIVLNPYDMYVLCRELNTSFDVLYSEGKLRLELVDGLMLPGLNVRREAARTPLAPLAVEKQGEDETRSVCVFLGADGRCSIHNARPDICRLFPLARLYEENSFSYILQIGQCPMQDGTKYRVSKWLGIPELKRYEKWILQWHELMKRVSAEAEAAADQETKKRIMMGFFTLFYRRDYDVRADFYAQFEDRLKGLGL